LKKGQEMQSNQRPIKFPPIGADTVPKLLRLRVRELGEKVFMRRKNLGIWKSYTFLQVYEQVRNICLGLLDLGLQEGETITIIGENELETFWTEYAALCARAKVVCVYPDTTPQELEFILDNSETVVVIAEDQEQVDKTLEVRPKLKRLRQIVYWDPRGMWHYNDPILMEFKEIQERGKKYGQKNPEIFDQKIDSGQRGDVAVLSYTSGTTANPKGVVMNHNFLLDNALRIFANLPIKKFTRYLSYLSPAWATEQWFGITLGLLAPFEINFPEEPETIQSNIRELGAGLLVFGPRQWESLASSVQSHMLDAGSIRRFFYDLGLKVGYKIAAGETEGKRVNILWFLVFPFADQFILKPLRDNLGLKNCYLPISGGSAMAPDVFRFFHAMGIKLRNAYGCTEAGMFTTHMGNKFNLETLGSWYVSHRDIGPSFESKVTEEGELQVRGGAGFQGYFRNPEATRKAQEDGWFKTGDAVRMTDDGQLIYLDRVADLRQLSDGYKFPPQFIETRLRFSPFIKDAIILGDIEKPYVSALINIDAENTGKWAEKRGIAYSTFPDLSQNEGVRNLISQEIARVNQMLDLKARVKYSINLPKELDPDEAELTRTRKLRREFLEKKYGEMIQNIYGGSKEFLSEIPVKYQDGRTSVVKATVYINPVEPEHPGDSAI
jgi:long-chain acyl-CoA synthetase